jgi:hypothetical protein
MRKLSLTLLTCLFILSPNVVLGTDKYVCQVTKKQFCGEKECKSIKILDDDYRIIDVPTRKYHIGKDVFNLESLEHSGTFIIFKVGGVGYLKMNYLEYSELTGMKRGQFLEVRDTFLSTITSWGICKF